MRFKAAHATSPTWAVPALERQVMGMGQMGFGLYAFALLLAFFAICFYLNQLLQVVRRLVQILHAPLIAPAR